MSYIKINKHYIFYEEERFAEIEASFLSSLSNGERLTLNVLDYNGKPKEKYLELMTLRNKYLIDEVRRMNSMNFIRKWVQFEYFYEDAQEHYSEILQDYFEIRKNGFISKETYDDEFISQVLTVGVNPERHFLNFVKPTNKLLTKLIRQKIFSKIEIAFEDIYYISGSLKEVEIHSKNQIIKLSDIVESSFNVG